MSQNRNHKILPIVITNWNGSHDTIECISSIFDSSYKNWHIVLIDNNSRTEDVEVLKSFLKGKEQIS